jgi:methionyl-tRNA formyltransferase
LHDRFAAIGARLLVSAVERAAMDTLAGVPQAALGVPAAEIAATLTHPLRADDLAIDWSWSSQRIADAVRSLSPAPLARACVPGLSETVKIVAARSVETGTAGAAWIHGDDAFVACGDGVVALERVIPPNRGAMSGAAYLRRSLRAS